MAHLACAPDSMQVFPSTQAPPPFGALQTRQQPAQHNSQTVVTTSVVQSALPPHPPLRSDAHEQLANKEAEVSVLRKRLQQMERENSRIVNELAMSRDQGPQNERGRQLQAEVARLQDQLRYANQDLSSSEDERKRLQIGLQGAQTELSTLKAQQNNTTTVQPMPVQAARTCAAPAVTLPGVVSRGQTSPTASTPGSAPSCPRLSPIAASSASLVAASAMAQHGRLGSSMSGAQSKTAVDVSKQWRQEAVMRELACWEAASIAVVVDGYDTTSVPTWFELRETANRFARECVGPASFGVKRSLSNGVAATPTAKGGRAATDLAIAVAARIRVAGEKQHWIVVRGGARFVQVWFGLFPVAISELTVRAAGECAQQAGADGLVANTLQRRTRLFEVLPDVFHSVVLERPSIDTAAVATRGQAHDSRDRQECATQILATLVEIAGKLRPSELDVLTSVLRRPSLCALLAQRPCAGSLHLPCMRLLQALFASCTLFSQAHQSVCHENLLLAAANLLIVPAADSGVNDGGGQDGPELQRCRLLALELFSRCLASAPDKKLDSVLQLRGAKTINSKPVDTVLQRVVLLCHHELICLGVHGLDGGPWHDVGLRECAKMRLRVVELALMMLSSFVWHVVPWAPDKATPEEHKTACIDACTAFGRTRPLLASIVDMVVRRAADSPPYDRFLCSVSALRILLAHVDGDDSLGVEDDGACQVDLGGSSTMVVD